MGKTKTKTKKTTVVVKKSERKYRFDKRIKRENKLERHKGTNPPFLLT